MKKLNRKILLITITMLLLLAGCMDSYDDDIESANSLRYTTWGFMSVTGGEYYVETDTKKTLKLQDFDNSSLKVSQGDRVYMAFNIVENKNENLQSNATYTNLVKIIEMYVVDYGNITTITEKNRPTIKNGYVNVKGVKITANNLNFELEYKNSDDKAHNILLCYDTDYQVEGKALQLDLKNNSEVSSSLPQTVSKLQSYNIATIENLGTKNSEGNVEFVVVSNRGTANQQEFNLVYQP